LDEDHTTKRGEFNQKPYYRLLINILRVMNESNILKKTHLTHLQGLYSLADLLIKINPMKYPAFAFAWLELISHKTFMPEFLGILRTNKLQHKEAILVKEAKKVVQSKLSFRSHSSNRATTISRSGSSSRT